MKKLFTILLSITLLFIFTLNTKTTNIMASVDTVPVTKDDGTVVTYRGSSEQVLRAASYNYPTQRLRATWASCFIGSISSFSTKEKWISDFDQMLDNLEEFGLNCLVFHVRTHNNALYKSKLNPVATWFSKVNFDEFDPLEYCIEACHKRGIEFHAWLNPYRVYDGYCAEDYPAVNPASNTNNILSNGKGRILDPGIPAVQSFLVDTCMEIVENYDVDAIHFDDYFYISDVDDSATRTKYNTSNLSLGDFRRQAVDKFIEALSNSLRAYNKKNNKAVQLGIAPSGIYRNGKYTATPSYNSDGSLKSPLYSNTSGFSHYDDYLYADTLKWINNEWIDYMMPQAYWAIEHTGASYADLTKWWSWACRNRKVNLYMGMGYYMAASTGSSANYWKLNKNEMRDQILNAQLYDEIGGYCLYSYNFLYNSSDVIQRGMNLLKNDYNVVKIPADVKQYYADILPKVELKNIKYEEKVISWDKKDNIRGYIVYKVDKKETLNQNDINQIYYYGTDNQITVDDPLGSTYYVAGINLANVIGPVINTDALTTNHTVVEELIDELPDLITFNEETPLSKIKEFYNQLSSEEQAKVSNYDIYLAKQAILDHKKETVENSNNYQDLNNYSYEKRSLIRQELVKLKHAINDAVDSNAVDALYKAYQDLIDSYPLIDEELNPIRTEAIQELEEYHNNLELDYYTNIDKLTMEDDLEDAKDRINQALSSTDIKKIVNETKELLDKYPNFKEEYLTKSTSFTNYINELASEYKDYSVYETYYNSEVEQLIQTALKIEKGTFVNNYDSILQTNELRLLDLQDEITKIVKAYNLAYKRIENYSDDVKGAKELKELYLSKIKENTDIDKFNNLVEEFKEEYNKLKQNEEQPVAPKPVDPVNPEPKNNDNGCNSSAIIISFLSSISLLFIFRKKH